MECIAPEEWVSHFEQHPNNSVSPKRAPGNMKLKVHHFEYQLDIPKSDVRSIVTDVMRKECKSNNAVDQLRKYLREATPSDRRQWAAWIHVWLTTNSYFYFAAMVDPPEWCEIENDDTLYLVYKHCQHDVPDGSGKYQCAACQGLHKTCYRLWGNDRFAPVSNYRGSSPQPISCGSTSPQCVLSLIAEDEYGEISYDDGSSSRINEADYNALGACIDAAIQRRLR